MGASETSLAADERQRADMHPAVEGQRILQVRLSADLYEWLRTNAFYERRSMNAIVNEALEQHRARREER